MGVGQATWGQGVVLSRSSRKTGVLATIPLCPRPHSNPPRLPVDLGEKADLVFYDTWLLIPDHPFTKALENKASSESLELRGLLMKRVT